MLVLTFVAGVCNFLCQTAFTRYVVQMIDTTKVGLWVGKVLNVDGKNNVRPFDIVINKSLWFLFAYLPPRKKC